MILLVILSNNILFSPSIALIYHFVPDGSLFQYIKPHLSIVGNRLSYIALLKRVLAAISFVRKCSFHHPTLLLISIHHHPIFWNVTYFDSIPLRFESPLIALQLQAHDAVNNPFPYQVNGL